MKKRQRMHLADDLDDAAATLDRACTVIGDRFGSDDGMYEELVNATATAKAAALRIGEMEP